MASWQMNVVAAFTRLAYQRGFATEQAGRRILARPKRPSAPPKSITRRYDVSTTHDHGFDLHRVRTGPSGTGVTVVYLHGGAYTNEIVGPHWSLIAHLADRTGHEVAVPIYGLAPAHHALQALEFVTAVITAEVARGRRVYLAGDSAGGGLALLAAQAAGGPAGGVAGLTAIAPWLDLSMANPEVDALEPSDPWLRRAGLRPLAAAWAGDVALTDPRVSPLYGDLAILPPTQILVGTRDITMPDCRVLRDRIPQSVPLTYHEQEGAVHVYPLLPVPEARQGRLAVTDHIRQATR
ncbi:alpha/beta hydrolase fold domain-containing protein [Actinoplanes derwentensis]|uniref:Acetyl esterase/lipase n=1 Tax=Actinoplanes derwentensis TaxID=113562 RepID=A0A1H1WW91_9ACTN|nr:alpha/beta hydrolase [Actinoplanes derwentensis]GID86963.1 esterase [Actinoplanes derwentensis]SDT00950.1 Acetyl esterase/lipase [Actinoplanes derwentensis]